MAAAGSIDMPVITSNNVQCHNFMLNSGTCLKSHAFPFSAVSVNNLYNTLMRFLSQVKLRSSNEVGEIEICSTKEEKSEDC
jgi:hypothetical protein